MIQKPLLQIIDHLAWQNENISLKIFKLQKEKRAEASK